MYRVLVVVVFFKGRRVLEFSPLKRIQFLGEPPPKDWKEWSGQRVLAGSLVLLLVTRPGHIWTLETLRHGEGAFGVEKGWAGRHS